MAHGRRELGCFWECSDVLSKSRLLLLGKQLKTVFALEGRSRCRLASNGNQVSLKAGRFPLIPKHHRRVTPKHVLCPVRIVPRREQHIVRIMSTKSPFRTFASSITYIEGLWMRSVQLLSKYQRVVRHRQEVNFNHIGADCQCRDRNLLRARNIW